MCLGIGIAALAGPEMGAVETGAVCNYAKIAIVKLTFANFTRIFYFF